MKKLYLAGGFNFAYKDFLKDNRAISNDYRAKLFEKLGINPLLLIGSNKDQVTPVHLDNENLYIGPFYFYKPMNKFFTEQQLVVNTERSMVDDCTDAVFFIDKDNVPGTITEMIHAALSEKNVHIFYVPNFDGSVEGDLDTKCWYPITFCVSVNPTHTFVQEVSDIDEFIEKLLEI